MSHYSKVLSSRLLVLALSSAVPLWAATLTVANTNDSGLGSLRQAIADATPGDTINFSVTGTITLTSGELFISKNLTISGPGASSLAISGNNSSRVFNIGSGTVAISGLTIQNGNASLGGAGGGIDNGGTLTVTNSTLSGNSASAGGGIVNFGALTLANSTLSGNSGGSGILNSDGSTTLKNAIVANSGGNCSVASGTFTSQGHNLSSDGTCASFFTPPSDLNNTDPALDPGGLKNNGGPTQTIALQATSPAVDAIPVSECTDVNLVAVATDQRGVARPQGPACDIGAFELVQLTSITVTPANSTINVGQTQQFTATGTFSDGSSRVLTAGGGTWATKAPMPTGTDGMGAAAVNGIIYAVGGEVANDCTFVRALVAYDPLGDAWTTKAPMPTARTNLSAGVVNGVLYAVGGDTGCGPRTGTVEAYDPASNTWTTRAPMPTPRAHHAVGVVSGVLYSVGGFNGAPLPTVEAYDPMTDTWTTKAPMPTPRYGLAVGVVNGLLYAAGGANDGPAPTTVEVYDPATNTWTTRAPMPTGRAFVAGGVVNGIFYVLGGSNGPILAIVEAYNPLTDTWTTAPSMPTARAALRAAGVNGVLYAVGGAQAGPTDLATNEVLTPPEVLWSSSKPTIATIDQTGMATGLSPGTATITASSGTISGSTTLTAACTLPTAVASGTAAICQGSSTPLSGSGGVSCSWSPGTGLDHPASCTPNASPVSTMIYTLTVTDANNCVSTNNPTVIVTVNPLPAATITAGGPTTFCTGGSVTLTANAASSYRWSTSASTQSIVVSASGSYSVTVTDANGCSATSAPTTVTVNPLPDSTITAPATVCPGSTGNTASVPDTGAGATYSWKITNGTITSGAGTRSVHFTVGTTGVTTLHITVTNGYGCTSKSVKVVKINKSC